MDEQLREKLDKIYAHECMINYHDGTVTISNRGWGQILQAIEEAGYIYVGSETVGMIMEGE